jgi:hypothetical protein
MDAKKKYHSSSQDRRLTTYLEHREYIMFTAERSREFLLGESKHLKTIVEKYYQSIPKEEQNKLIDEYYYKLNKSKNKGKP